MVSLFLSLCGICVYVMCGDGMVLTRFVCVCSVCHALYKGHRTTPRSWFSLFTFVFGSEFRSSGLF